MRLSTHLSGQSLQRWCVSGWPASAFQWQHAEPQGPQAGILFLDPNATITDPDERVHTDPFVKQKLSTSARDREEHDRMTESLKTAALRCVPKPGGTPTSVALSNGSMLSHTDMFCRYVQVLDPVMDPDKRYDNLLTRQMFKITQTLLYTGKFGEAGAIDPHTAKPPALDLEFLRLLEKLVFHLDVSDDEPLVFHAHATPDADTGAFSTAVAIFTAAC